LGILRKSPSRCKRMAKLGTCLVVATSLDATQYAVSLQRPWCSLSIAGYFLGVIAKPRKATISFVMAARPPTHMHRLDSHWTDFREIRYWRVLFKSVEKIQVWLTQL
jgi:hypothetical protein